MLLAVLGVISALGIYSDVAGPAGHAIDRTAAAAFGGARYLLPFALLFGGLALLVPMRGRAADDDEEYEDDEERPGRGWRLAVGLALTGLSIVGLMYVSHDDRRWTLRTLQHAGGVLGAAVGAPLRAGLGPAGAVIVLGALGLLGVLLFVGTGLRQVGHGLSLGARVVGRKAGALVSLPRDEDAAAQVADDEIASPADVDLRAWQQPEPGDEAEGEELVAELEDLEYGDDEEYEEDDEDDEDEEAAEYEDDEEYEDEEEEADDDVAAGAGQPAVVAEEQLAINLPPVHRPSAWKLPAASVLKRSESSKVDPQLVQEGGEILEATMRQFGVDARLLGATVGPTVTRYELELAPGVKVNKVTSLAKEIAYSMASHDVRILAPIPGRSAIGVEVPNKMRPIVTLGDILASPEAKKAKHPLEVGMGRDIAGNAVLANLATFPHVLIAGQTGAGKSSCINSIVTSILVRTTPDQVRLILVDPKRVELGQYNSVPHLLTEVVTNPKRAANALDWAVREMEMRYDMLADIGVRDIAGYNAMVDRGDLPTHDDPDPETGKAYDRLPFIVVVVDELADLMMVAARDVETSICRLAQMARAVGIHLVIATQRPSVDVITGVIKANIPSRLAFSVSTLADSRVILDQMGAEKLIGKGDMLMLTASSSRTERVQGAWVDEECVRKVVAHWRRQVVEPIYVDGVQGADGRSGGLGGGDDDDSDELLGEAMDLVVRAGLGSTSMLQRKLRVGFARAGRLMDLLERRGVVGPSEGSKARAVLMSVDELEEMSAR